MNSIQPKSFHLGAALALVIGLLFILAASGCTLTQPISDFLGSASPTQGEDGPTGEIAALVTFNVQVPADTPPGEPVLISILDEVTGLALNAKRYPMESTQDGHYIIGLPFTPGTTIKYRYSRRGDILAEEHTTDGRAVRYRLFRVDGPGEVHDVVSRWNDTTFQGPSGRIAGTVTSAASGNPLPGILVAAGGAQAITTSDGSFLLEGLSPGTHNLVAYAQNGAYLTFQHGALVAAQSTTPAPIQLTRAPKVDITFILHVPDDTPPIVPIRLAGNLTQLGNTFADLSGGTSTLAARMPVLSLLPDGTYGVILGLPAGAHIRYKYTLGDGFWNAERADSGEWVLRELIVPEQPTVIEDTISTWHAGSAGPITFDLTVPADTPPQDEVYIQFNPFGWTEPIPMWHLGASRWAYVLYSPLDQLPQLGYRFCRAGQCGQADDARTPGPHNPGQVLQPANDAIGLVDQVPSWAWWQSEPPNPVDLAKITREKPFETDFITGIELQDRYHPSWLPRFTTTLSDIYSAGANHIFLTPSWTFSRLDPPVLEAVTGKDPSWQDTAEMVARAQNQGFQVALRPVPHFPQPVDTWWSNANRDFSWWVSWFDRYTRFALHYAELAERTGVETLILGGGWMSPALPGGTLVDGNPSGVPEDAPERYQALIAEVRQHFSGTLGWAFVYPDEIRNPPEFIHQVDLVYILWSLPLTDETEPKTGQMRKVATQSLTSDLYASMLAINLESSPKKIVLALAYPSITGGVIGCLSDPIAGCIAPESLDYPVPDYPLLNLDLAVQAQAYQAVLSAISATDWIDGVTTRGYYPPTLLQDKSTSLHGKPAEDVLRHWFQAFTQGQD
jgi:hypothetical protein